MTRARVIPATVRSLCRRWAPATRLDSLMRIRRHAAAKPDATLSSADRPRRHLVLKAYGHPHALIGGGFDIEIGAGIFHCLWTCNPPSQSLFPQSRRNSARVGNRSRASMLQRRMFRSAGPLTRAEVLFVAAG